MKKMMMKSMMAVFAVSGMAAAAAAGSPAGDLGGIFDKGSVNISELAVAQKDGGIAPAVPEAAPAQDAPLSGLQREFRAMMEEMFNLITLAGRVECLAKQWLGHSSRSALAREWARTSPVIAAGLKKETEALLAAARESDERLVRELEIAGAQAAPVKKYLLNAHKYLELLSEVGGMSLPNDVREANERFIEEMRAQARRIMRY